MANGNIEVAKAFVTIVPSMEGSQATITKELTGVTTEASEKAGSESGSKFGEKFAAGIKGATAAIGTAMAAATGAAVATGKAFVDAANDVSSMGDAIGDNAAKLMLDTQSYQEWDFVLQRAGSSIDAMKTSMKTLAISATEGKDAFAELGITEEQLASMNQAELFEATVKSLQNVTDEQTRMTLASQLLGKGATELGAVFSMTNEELDASKQKMYELGAYMDEDAIAASDNYQDTMLDMQDALKGLKISMMTDFLPGVTSVMDGLAKVFSGNGGIDEIKEGLSSVISNLSAKAPEFFSLAETLIMSLLEGFGPMLPSLATTIFNVLNQGLLTVVTMLPQLLPAIETGIQALLSSLFQCLPIITQNLLTLVTDLVVWLASGDNITTFINGIIELVSMISDQISQVLPVILPAIVELINQLSLALSSPENIQTILMAVLEVAGAIFMALVNCVPVLIDFVIGLFDDIGTRLGDFLSWIVPIVAQGLETAVNKVKEWLNAAKTFLSNIGANIRSGVVNFITNIKLKITSWISGVVSKIKEFGTNIINTIKELPSKVISIGKNLVEGLWNGINDKISWVKNKISGMGSQITSAIKKVFGIASPSKLWRDQVGSMLALGLGEGFMSSMDDVEEDMTAKLDKMTGSMTAEVSAYGAGGASVVGDTNYNGGNVTINVYGAEGQDVNELAQIIAQKLDEMTRRKELVYG